MLHLHLSSSALPMTHSHRLRGPRKQSLPRCTLIKCSTGAAFSASRPKTYSEPGLDFGDFLGWKGCCEIGQGLVLPRGACCYLCGLPWVMCNPGKRGSQECTPKDVVFPLLWLAGCFQVLRLKV